MRLRLGGVPEHFNMMWQLPAGRELLRSYGFAIEWKDFPGGTGAMTEALEKMDIDVAIMLTEGAISAIASGKIFQIMFPFVISPLLWGVFSASHRSGTLPDNYGQARFAISRMNSGSHLMAKFLAQRQGFKLGEDQFVISQDLTGARNALKQEMADYFLWEKYMTRPLVRSGEFIQSDEVSAPWPSFVFVVKRNFTQLDTEAWKQAVYELTSEFLESRKEEIAMAISREYDLLETEASEWLEQVKYYDNNNYWTDRITAAVIIMYEAGMISVKPGLTELI